jgi:hypothetical protein
METCTKTKTKKLAKKTIVLWGDAFEENDVRARD